MKIAELLSGVTIPLTNEENELLGKCKEASIIAKKDLTPREQEVMNSLVKKDIVTRHNHHAKITYSKKIRDY